MRGISPLGADLPSLTNAVEKAIGGRSHAHAVREHGRRKVHENTRVR